MTVQATFRTAYDHHHMPAAYARLNRKKKKSLRCNLMKHVTPPYWERLKTILNYKGTGEWDYIYIGETGRSSSKHTLVNNIIQDRQVVCEVRQVKSKGNKHIHGPSYWSTWTFIYMLIIEIMVFLIYLFHLSLDNSTSFFWESLRDRWGSNRNTSMSAAGSTNLVDQLAVRTPWSNTRDSMEHRPQDPTGGAT